MITMNHDVTGDGIIIDVPNSFRVAYDKKKQKKTTCTKRKAATNQLQMEPAAKRVPLPTTPPPSSVSNVVPHVYDFITEFEEETKKRVKEQRKELDKQYELAREQHEKKIAKDNIHFDSTKENIMQFISKYRQKPKQRECVHETTEWKIQFIKDMESVPSWDGYENKKMSPHVRGMIDRYKKELANEQKQ